MAMPANLPQDPPMTVEPVLQPSTTPTAAARAVGVLMAATPCTTRDAKRILAAAADLARINVHDLAVAVVAGTEGTPLPARIERALRRAVEAARTSKASAPASVGLAPNRQRTEEVLTRLRGCRARLAAEPGDPAAARAMDDAAYTLCVLMGRPTTHDAVLAAERHLGPRAL
ncbi:DUF5133 domain-containing protein [Streptomyces sp. NPDC016459]|uniref:DUF5133 domain-containing protein n=1 Tax=Streptomyces sp. NPDC016459 TaxID=3157190 RepID=UPI0033EC3F99